MQACDSLEASPIMPCDTPILKQNTIQQINRTINNQLAMKKLLFTFALAGVVSAGAAFKACAFSAIAFNPDTGRAGWANDYTNLEAAKTRALEECPGGHIVFTGDSRGFYAVDRWRDDKGDSGIVYGRGNTLSEVYQKNIKWCSDRGRTIIGHAGWWRETIGSPQPTRFD